MSVMGNKGGKRASNSMVFLFTASALLVVLVSLSFPSPADAFGRVPNFKLRYPSPPPKKLMYIPPTPTKRPIYVPPTPPKKSPPPVPKKPPHYVPSKPPKKPIKPKSPPPPYKQHHMPSTVFTTSKWSIPKPVGKVFEIGIGNAPKIRDLFQPPPPLVLNFQPPRDLDPGLIPLPRHPKRPRRRFPPIHS